MYFSFETDYEDSLIIKNRKRILCTEIGIGFHYCRCRARRTAWTTRRVGWTSGTSARHLWSVRTDRVSSRTARRWTGPASRCRAFSWRSSSARRTRTATSACLPLSPPTAVTAVPLKQGTLSESRLIQLNT